MAGNIHSILMLVIQLSLTLLTNRKISIPMKGLGSNIVIIAIIAVIVAASAAFIIASDNDDENDSHNGTWYYIDDYGYDYGGYFYTGTGEEQHSVEIKSINGDRIDARLLDCNLVGYYSDNLARFSYDVNEEHISAIIQFDGDDAVMICGQVNDTESYVDVCYLSKDKDADPMKINTVNLAGDFSLESSVISDVNGMIWNSTWGTETEWTIESKSGYKNAFLLTDGKDIGMPLALIKVDDNAAIGIMNSEMGLLENVVYVNGKLMTNTVSDVQYSGNNAIESIHKIFVQSGVEFDPTGYQTDLAGVSIISDSKDDPVNVIQIVNALDGAISGTVFMDDMSSYPMTGTASMSPAGYRMTLMFETEDSSYRMTCNADGEGLFVYYIITNLITGIQTFHSNNMSYSGEMSGVWYVNEYSYYDADGNYVSKSVENEDYNITILGVKNNCVYGTYRGTAFSGTIDGITITAYTTLNDESVCLKLCYLGDRIDAAIFNVKNSSIAKCYGVMTKTLGATVEPYPVTDSFIGEWELMVDFDLSSDGTVEVYEDCTLVIDQVDGRIFSGTFIEPGIQSNIFGVIFGNGTAYMMIDDGIMVWKMSLTEGMMCLEREYQDYEEGYIGLSIWYDSSLEYPVDLTGTQWTTYTEIILPNGDVTGPNKSALMFDDDRYSPINKGSLYSNGDKTDLYMITTPKGNDSYNVVVMTVKEDGLVYTFTGSMENGVINVYGYYEDIASIRMIMYHLSPVGIWDLKDSQTVTESEELTVITYDDASRINISSFENGMFTGTYGGRNMIGCINGGTISFQVDNTVTGSFDYFFGFIDDNYSIIHLTSASIDGKTYCTSATAATYYLGNVGYALSGLADVKSDLFSPNGAAVPSEPIVGSATMISNHRTITTEVTASIVATGPTIIGHLTCDLLSEGEGNFVGAMNEIGGGYSGVGMYYDSEYSYLCEIRIDGDFISLYLTRTESYGVVSIHMIFGNDLSADFSDIADTKWFGYVYNGNATDLVVEEKRFEVRICDVIGNMAFVEATYDDASYGTGMVRVYESNNGKICMSGTTAFNEGSNWLYLTLYEGVLSVVGYFYSDEWSELDYGVLMPSDVSGTWNLISSDGTLGITDLGVVLDLEMGSASTFTGTMSVEDTAYEFVGFLDLDGSIFAYFDTQFGTFSLAGGMIDRNNIYGVLSLDGSYDLSKVIFTREGCKTAEFPEIEPPIGDHSSILSFYWNGEAQAIEGKTISIDEYYNGMFIGTIELDDEGVAVEHQFCGCILWSDDNYLCGKAVLDNGVCGEISFYDDGVAVAFTELHDNDYGYCIRYYDEMPENFEDLDNIYLVGEGVEFYVEEYKDGCLQATLRISDHSVELSGYISPSPSAMYVTLNGVSENSYYTIIGCISIGIDGYVFDGVIIRDSPYGLTVDELILKKAIYFHYESELFMILNGVEVHESDIGINQVCLIIDTYESNLITGTWWDFDITGVLFGDTIEFSTVIDGTSYTFKGFIDDNTLRGSLVIDYEGEGASLYLTCMTLYETEPKESEDVGLTALEYGLTCYFDGDICTLVDTGSITNLMEYDNFYAFNATIDGKDTEFVCTLYGSDGSYSGYGIANTGDAIGPVELFYNDGVLTSIAYWFEDDELILSAAVWASTPIIDFSTDYNIDGDWSGERYRIGADGVMDIMEYTLTDTTPNGAFFKLIQGESCWYGYIDDYDWIGHVYAYCQLENGHTIYNGYLLFDFIMILYGTQHLDDGIDNSMIAWLSK